MLTHLEQCLAHSKCSINSGYCLIIQKEASMSFLPLFTIIGHGQGSCTGPLSRPSGTERHKASESVMDPIRTSINS